MTKTNKQIYSEGEINFKHNGGGNWEFSLPTVKSRYTFLSKSPAGKDGAVRIARILAGALKRTKGAGVDGMARKMISNLLAPAPQHNPIVF